MQQAAKPEPLALTPSSDSAGTSPWLAPDSVLDRSSTVLGSSFAPPSTVGASTTDREPSRERAMDLSRLNLLLPVVIDRRFVSSSRADYSTGSQARASRIDAIISNEGCSAGKAGLGVEFRSSVNGRGVDDRSRTESGASCRHRPPLRLLQQSGLQHRQPSPSLSH
jgi:hypothetical protein